MTSLTVVEYKNLSSDKPDKDINNNEAPIILTKDISVNIRSISENKINPMKKIILNTPSPTDPDNISPRLHLAFPQKSPHHSK